MFGRHAVPVTLAAALLGAAGSASAQDAQQLQNLQRVIEQQQRQIQAQQQALEDLRRQVEAMQQRSEQAAKTATQAQDVASHAQQTAEAAQKSGESPRVTSAEPKVSLEVSGQINRMVNVANDGKSTKAYFVDNNNSASRVRFVGKAKVNDDLTLGPYIEVAIQPNPSNKVSQTNETVSDADDVFDARKVEGIAQSKTYGAVYLGKGDPSAKDIARIDLSGTDVLAYANVSDIAGGLLSEPVMTTFSPTPRSPTRSPTSTAAGRTGCATIRRRSPGPRFPPPMARTRRAARRCAGAEPSPA